MGGSAFSTVPLDTPRMPPDVYNHVKFRCRAALNEMFLCVASPIEGPGKQDHGDIDLLVVLEKSVCLGRSQSTHAPFATKEEAREAIKEALAARYAIYENTDHFAIPWPTEYDLNSPGQSQGGSKKRYIQVDVTICESLERMQWTLFKEAHGDLWNILGATIRPYGLTIDEQALWVRIPDIEKFNRTKAKVFLTADPYDILAFLGLEVGKYWEEPFDSLDDMYEYVATSRMFWVRPEDEVLPTTAAPLPPPPPSPLPLSSASNVQPPPDTNTNADRRKLLKSSDRRRMNSRPGFAKWINEFLPRCRAEGRFATDPTSRAEVRAEAFARFGVDPVWRRQHHEFMCARSRERVWADVKASLPPADRGDTRQCQYRGCLSKALKRIIFEGDESYGIVPESELQDGSGLMIEDEVARFVAKYADAVGQAAMMQHDQAYAKLKRKVEGGSEKEQRIKEKEPEKDAGL